MGKTEELLNWYIENQTSLVEKYNGKTLVIKDFSVVKSFDKKVDAYFFAIENYQEGEFILQDCSPGDDAYTATFYSRIAGIAQN